MLKSEIENIIDIDGIVNAAIVEALNFEEDKPEIGVYRPSMVGKCIRANYLIYKFGVVPSEDKARIFAIGNIIHVFIQEKLKEKYGDLVKVEVPVEKSFEVYNIKVRGRVDVLFNEKYIIELKTTNNLKKWNSELRIHEEMKAPYDDHVLQLMLYLGMLKLKHGYIVYVEKNTLKTKTFRVDFNLDVYEKAITRIVELHNYLVNDKLPPAEALKNPNMRWQCRFCEFREKCWRLEGISKC